MKLFDKLYQRFTLPDPRKTVIMIKKCSFNTTSLLELEQLILKDKFTSFLVSVEYMSTDTMVDAWSVQQFLQRMKKENVSIVFHVNSRIDIYSLAAISTYPVYLNKYANLDVEKYISALPEIRSDLRIMANAQSEYNCLLVDRKNGHYFITATEASTLRLITGISDEYLTKIVAASVLVKPKDVKDANFISIGEIYHEYD